METTTQANRMHSLLILYDMHTTYFSSALESITDDDAHQRLNTKANHIMWLTGSLVQERCELAGTLDKEYKQKADELFNNHQGIKDNMVYPSLGDFKKDWENISPVLREAFLNVTDDKLDSTFEMMPGMTMTHFDLIAFMTYREANCIGQIALWRRLLGYQAIKYM